MCINLNSETGNGLVTFRAVKPREAGPKQATCLWKLRTFFAFIAFHKVSDFWTLKGTFGVLNVEGPHVVSLHTDELLAV